MEHSGLSRQTLHNYTMLGLLGIAKRTASGHRLYDESVFEQIAKIQKLKKDHTLDEIRRILHGGTRKARRRAAPPREVGVRIAEKVAGPGEALPPPRVE